MLASISEVCESVLVVCVCFSVCISFWCCVFFSWCLLGFYFICSYNCELLLEVAVGY